MPKVSQMSASEKLHSWIREQEHAEGTPGLREIKDIEGKGTLTTGWGSTSENWPEIKKLYQEGKQPSRAQIEYWATEDVKRFERMVRQNVSKDSDLTQGEYDAIISYAYNTGFSESKMPKAMAALRGGGEGWREVFKREAFSPEHGYTSKDPKLKGGLINRRLDELAIFEQGVYDTYHRRNKSGQKWMDGGKY